MPVLEALNDTAITIERVLIARGAKGESVSNVLSAASARGVTVQRVTADKVTRVSGNGRHDQGVVAEIDAPGIAELDAWLLTAPASGHLLVLDGVTNPANVGLIVRSAVAAGLCAVVLPRAGSPDVGPLMIKASAGVALRADILRVQSAAEALDRLGAAGFETYGLRSRDATPLWRTVVGPRAAFVLGSETDGVSPAVAALVTEWVSLPMANGVDSLNVASVAAIVGYELARRSFEASQRPR
jgi:23S rRNA (guanosine2251-2'-O)-methyltransferase